MSAHRTMPSQRLMLDLIMIGRAEIMALSQEIEHEEYGRTDEFSPRVVSLNDTPPDE